MTDASNPFLQFAPVSAPQGSAPVNPFAQFVPTNAAPAPDKYQQAAADQIAAAKAAGAPDQSYGPAESFINGRMLGALPTVMAGLTTPAAMIAHGTLDPVEGYNYAKALENSEADAGAAAHPYLNGAANIAGGVMTGVGAAKAGLTFAPTVAAGEAAPGLLATAGGMAADGAAYGGLTGFNSGEGSGRLTGAAGGAALGGVLGAALPIGINAATSNPIVSQIAARANPEGFASSQLARAMMESGETPEALQGALDNATAAGQPNFALADALGNPGQRMLTTVTKSPGQGRTDAVDFLNGRQAGQSGSVSSILADALGAPQTAEQTSVALKAARSADAATNYGAARTGEGVGPVDVTPAITLADQTLMPGVTRLINPNSNIADNSIESAVARAKSYLTDGESNLSDFSQVLQAKKEIDNLIEGGSPSQQQALIPIKEALDAQLVKASPAYANARDTFAAQSAGIDALPLGASAASGRVRAPDAVGQFEDLQPQARQPFRVGFSDPIIAKAESTPYGADAARPLLNTAMQEKLGSLSLHNGPYQPGAQNAVEQRLGRESTMHETRQIAAKGSQTVENMNDQHAAGIDPSAIWDAASEGVPGLIRGAVRVGSNFLGGSTPAVREALGKALTMHGPTADVVGALGPAMEAKIQRAALARAIMAGGMGGTGAGAANEIETSPNGRR